MSSQVVGENRNRLPTKKQLGKLGQEEDEPAREQRREHTDLGDKNKFVACHALAVAITDEEWQEAEM